MRPGVPVPPDAPGTWERHAGAVCAPLRGYRRRDPEKTLLHRVVRERLETFLAAARERSAHGRGLPAFVERELRAYIDCGSNVIKTRPSAKTSTVAPAAPATDPRATGEAAASTAAPDPRSRVAALAARRTRLPLAPRRPSGSPWKSRCRG